MSCVRTRSPREHAPRTASSSPGVSSDQLPGHGGSRIKLRPSIHSKIWCSITGRPCIMSWRLPFDMAIVTGRLLCAAMFAQSTAVADRQEGALPYESIARTTPLNVAAQAAGRVSDHTRARPSGAPRAVPRISSHTNASGSSRVSSMARTTSQKWAVRPANTACTSVNSAGLTTSAGSESTNGVRRGLLELSSTKTASMSCIVHSSRVLTRKCLALTLEGRAPDPTRAAFQFG
mmetsp:Transcript_2370/g.6026  ORF Transcript_2370/g.6026 Transcript_2370/m.6026 type:complete len:233 (-) Transcript_2370:251-949(-)